MGYIFMFNQTNQFSVLEKWVSGGGVYFDNVLLA